MFSNLIAICYSAVIAVVISIFTRDCGVSIKASIYYTRVADRVFAKGRDFVVKCISVIVVVM